MCAPGLWAIPFQGDAEVFADVAGGHCVMLQDIVVRRNCHVNTLGLGPRPATGDARSSRRPFGHRALALVSSALLPNPLAVSSSIGRKGTAPSVVVPRDRDILSRRIWLVNVCETRYSTFNMKVLYDGSFSLRPGPGLKLPTLCRDQSPGSMRWRFSPLERGRGYLRRYGLKVCQPA